MDVLKETISSNHMSIQDFEDAYSRGSVIIYVNI